MKIKLKHIFSILPFIILTIGYINSPLLEPHKGSHALIFICLFFLFILCTYILVSKFIVPTYEYIKKNWDKVIVDIEKPKKNKHKEMVDDNITSITPLNKWGEEIIDDDQTSNRNN